MTAENARVISKSKEYRLIIYSDIVRQQHIFQLENGLHSPHELAKYNTLDVSTSESSSSSVYTAKMSTLINYHLHEPAFSKLWNCSTSFMAQERESNIIHRGSRLYAYPIAKHPLSNFYQVLNIKIYHYYHSSLHTFVQHRTTCRRNKLFAIHSSREELATYTLSLFETWRDIRQSNICEGSRRITQWRNDNGSFAQ